MNNTKYKQKLLAIGYLIALPCLVLSIAMVYSIKTGGLKDLLYKDLVIKTVILLSLLTALLGIIKFFISFSEKGKRYKITLLSCMLVFISVFSTFSTIRFFQHYSFPYNIQRCQFQLRNLHEAMTAYHHDYGAFPPANQWCDALYQRMKKENPDFNYIHRFWCPGGAIRGRSDYAMNPEATEYSDEEIVLLFDSTQGWNQYGKKEMMNLDNHKGKGCNVLFVNGEIKFVPKDKIDNLKWSSEKDKTTTGEPCNIENAVEKMKETL